jgi:RNA polymerase sigma-70 factor (ECF subfamily)
VYAFIRRGGVTAEDAADLTQGFLTAMIEGEFFSRADREKGRFRSFLLGALKHFLAHDRERQMAKKRGGGIEFVPLDLALAESRYGANVQCSAMPEARFDRGWALAVLDRALARLKEEFERSGRGALWEGLKGFLLGDFGDQTFASVAAELRITEGAAKMTVSRLRQRFYALVRQEIADSVTDSQQLEEEFRTFMEALRA